MNIARFSEKVTPLICSCLNVGQRHVFISPA